jgi:acetyl-CoA acetyltransferase
MKDRVAIVGLGSTGFSRAADRSAASLAYEAAVRAIRDAGLTAADVDGVVNSPGLGRPGMLAPDARAMVAGLGLPRVTYFSDASGVIGGPLIEAANAIFAGTCKTVLLYHANYRTPYHSRKAATDPFRRSIPPYDREPVESMRTAVGYSAWLARYMYDHPSFRREHLGLIAINSRTNAISNPLAAIREPMTMQEYLGAPMIRDPLCMLDMDVPVDGAEAFILTSAERARNLPHPRVLVHAAVQGITGDNEEEQASLARHGQDVVAEELWTRSEVGLDGIDIAQLYDGFSFIALSWIEKLGWAPPGGGGPFLEENWSAGEHRILIGGRVPVNTHGGALSEGGTQGAGALREAVAQLRGEAGERQVAGARTALLTFGGFFFNSSAALLVRD